MNFIRRRKLISQLSLLVLTINKSLDKIADINISEEEVEHVVGELDDKMQDILDTDPDEIPDPTIDKRSPFPYTWCPCCTRRDYI